MIAGGVDAVLIETAQDLLQTKAAIVGAKRALAAPAPDLPIFAQVTVETTGTMLLGSEIGAALTALEPLGIDADRPQLRHRPGRDERAPAPPVPARPRRPSPACPTPACPCSATDGAHYPLTPDELADAHDHSPREYGLALVGGCCGTTPEHLRAGRRAGRAAATARSRAGRAPERRRRLALPAVPFRQDTSYLVDRRAHQRQRLQGVPRGHARGALGRLRRDRPRADPRRRAPARRLHRLRRPRRRRRHAARSSAGCATSSTLPLVLDSTEPPVLEAGLEHARRPRGRSTPSTTRTATARTRRFARIMPLVQEHGAAVVALTIDEEGQARTAERKVARRRPADRRPDRRLGHARRGHHRRLPDLPDRHRPGGDPPRRHRDDRGASASSSARYPEVQTTLGLSNVSFGLNPAARHRAQLGVPARVRQGRASTRRSCTRPRSCRSPASRRSSARSRSTSSTTAAYDADGNVTYDPLQRFLELFEGVDAAALKASPAPTELAALPARRAAAAAHHRRRAQRASRPTSTRRARHGHGAARHHQRPRCSTGMKTVGELLRRRRDAAAVRAAVRRGDEGRGRPTSSRTWSKSDGSAARARSCSRPCKGDVHDIGKNLVDIILTNNGYKVVNIGIKQPIADDHRRRRGARRRRRSACPGCS